MNLTKRQLEAAKLYKEALAGNPLAQFKFAESVSHSDLPVQLTPAIARTLQKRYAGNAEAQVHQRFTSRQLVDGIGVEQEYNIYGFNQDNIPAQNLGDDFIPGGLPAIMNRERYPQIGLSASGKKLKATQLGEAFGIDWQTIVNSRGTNVNLIDDGITEFARHASNEEDIRATKSVVNRTGFNTALLGTGAHAITGNPAIENIIDLQTAIKQAQAFTLDGVEMNITRFALLTTPTNAPVIRQAIAARRITRVPARTGTDSAVVSDQYEETIDLGAEVDIVANKWLKAIWPGIGRGYVLVPLGNPYPGITSNYLRGYETPSFWVKNSNALNYSGGEVPVLEGDFDSDAIQTKVRHVNGSNVLWNEGIVYSDGTNT